MKEYVENKYEHDSEPMLNYKDLQIVLSYIEQLENNRDKAIEMLTYKQNAFTTCFSVCDVIDILKGDSDE